MTFYPRSRQISNTPTRYETVQGGVFSKDQRYKGRSNYLHHTIVVSPGDFPASSCDTYLMPTQNVSDRIYSKAYDRFVDKMRSGQSASLGATVAEGRSAIEMIARRAVMLRKAWTAVRRGDIVGAAKHLAIPADSKRVERIRRSRRTPKGKVSKKHYASATWLELHFGWVPLIGDITDAMDVIEKSWPQSTKVVASASEPWSKNIVGYPRGSSSGVSGVRFEGDVRIDNPNLFRSAQLGLVNPAAIAWELVPFSFVIDWFSNVGQVLESYTDFLGVAWVGGSVSEKTTSSGFLVTTSQSMNLVTQRRGVLGAPPSPRMFVQSPLGGPKRAATQIALLVQLFIKP